MGTNKIPGGHAFHPGQEIAGVESLGLIETGRRIFSSHTLSGKIEVLAVK